MKRIAKFHKVSPEQFAKDWKDTFPAADDKEIQDTYEKISLPVRATAGMGAEMLSEKRTGI